MDRKRLERIWLDRANVAGSSMKGRAYVASEQRHLSYEGCARLLRSNRTDEDLVATWRQNAEQARQALDLRKHLENPSDKARWEVMVEVNTQCADELEGRVRVMDDGTCYVPAIRPLRQDRAG